MKWPNIIYKRDVSKFIEAEDNPYDNISLYKDIEYFHDDVTYTSFIKSVERLVRTSDDYNNFLNQIKKTYGLDFCQACSKLTGQDVTIEMHHGPIFTLYDICEVVLQKFIKTGYKINTLRIADVVLQEHFDLNVQIVMLAVTFHEAVHNKDMFLNLKQGFGDSAAFIEKYGAYLEDSQKYKIWNYINLSKGNDSFDRGILDVDKIRAMVKM